MRQFRGFTLVAVLGAALAGFGLSQVAQTLSFKDIAAGHWAKTAVEYIAARGLITGYQDGTYQGNRTLTRYEAAAIFYRLLQSGAISGVDNEGRSLLAKGMAEVNSELEQLRGRLGKLEGSDTDQASRISGLESQLRNLSVAPNTSSVDASRVLEARVAALEGRLNDFSGQDARLKNLEERVNKLAAQESRLAGLEAQFSALSTRQTESTQGLNARLQSLEGQTKGNADGLSKLANQTQGLSTQVQGLNTQVQTLSNQTQGINNQVQGINTQVQGLTTQAQGLNAQVQTLNGRADGLSNKFAGLNERVDTLENNVNRRLDSLESRVTALQKAPAPPAPSPSATRPTPTPPPSQPDLLWYVGGGGNYPLVPTPVFELSRSSYSAVFGVTRLLDLGITNLGLRLGLDYRPADNVFTVNPALTFSQSGFLSPYLGVGLGLSFVGNNDLFINGLAGVDLNLLPWAAVFAELDPRYTFASDQFALNTRFGLKIRF